MINKRLIAIKNFLLIYCDAYFCFIWIRAMSYSGISLLEFLFSSFILDGKSLSLSTF